ncbi:hypothetical protein HC028_16670 [Planosporangium flavigriseum]|uniref:Transposase n=1 Tax=Planosporangium flavigriseum TaxID=373681 RepID=A0A8J3PMS1_9ACTN|nr:hypothetical protein [Planosporangium flavigriseum]NJC66125.1 hypothetical protein [Planosporangium flavigriseum]GIG75182.1 hypothetical protein Pfl04_35860 [Planosporangium flavigriseum]
MSSSNQVPDPEVPAKARSRTYSASYKTRILARADVLAAAYTRTPERFVRKHPEPPALSGTVWINKPPSQDTDQAHPKNS